MRLRRASSSGRQNQFRDPKNQKVENFQQMLNLWTKHTLNVKRFVEVEWKKRFFICGKKCKTLHSMGHSAYATLIGGLVESNWLNVELVYIVSKI